MKKLILLFAMAAFLGIQAVPVSAADGECGKTKTECGDSKKKEAEKK